MKTKQYGGFARNWKTNEYDCLFVTEFSEKLAYERAREKAAANPETYLEDDICVKERTVEISYGKWM